MVARAGRERMGRPRRRTALALALLSLAVLTACAGGYVREPSGVPYSAYRPPFEPGPPRRTLFMRGYAGYNYGPVARRATVPTADGGDTWGYPVPTRAAHLGIGE
jgi:hypothetical protein